jgi:hypothetical protein
MAYSHIHSLIRLDTKGLPTHGFRYECVECGARLRKKSGVMIEPTRAANLLKRNQSQEPPVSNREDRK